MILDGKCFDRLWPKEDLFQCSHVFVVYNHGGSHWVLLYINIESRNLIILDPLGQVDVNSTLFKIAVCISDRILRQIFNCHIEKITQIDNVAKQQDTYNCGVFVCYYAKQLTLGNSLSQSFDTDKFRREIYESILNYSK